MLLRLLLCVGIAHLATGAIGKELELQFEEDMLEEFDLISDLETTDGVTPYSPYANIPLDVYFNIKSWKTLMERANMSQAKEFIDEQIKTYHTIDPVKSMGELTNVGALLRLAYSGAKGHKCSTPILTLMGGYQDLVKDSLITTSTFVEVALKSIRYHKYAIMFLDRDREDLSIKYLKKCSLMADRMSKVSALVEHKSDNLTGIAVDALKAANDDQVGESTEKRRISKVIEDLELKRKEQNQKNQSLKEKLKQEEKERKENTALANQKEKKRPGVFVRFWDWLKGDDKDARIKRHNERVRREKAAAKKAIEEGKASRKAWIKKQRENNNALRMSIEKLVTSNQVKDRLTQSIYGLDITLKTLGRIKTVFANARVFWNGLKRHLDALASNGADFQDFLDMLDEDLQDMMSEFRKMVRDSGYNWVAVGKMCQAAAVKMREVDAGLDHAMNNLPTSAEALVLIQTLSKELLKDIGENEKDLDAEERRAINQ